MRAEDSDLLRTVLSLSTDYPALETEARQLVTELETQVASLTAPDQATELQVRKASQLVVAADQTKRLLMELRLAGEYKHLPEFATYTDLNVRLFSVRTKLDLLRSQTSVEFDAYDGVEPAHAARRPQADRRGQPRSRGQRPGARAEEKAGTHAAVGRPAETRRAFASRQRESSGAGRCVGGEARERLGLEGGERVRVPEPVGVHANLLAVAWLGEDPRVPGIPSASLTHCDVVVGGAPRGRAEKDSKSNYNRPPLRASAINPRRAQQHLLMKTLELDADVPVPLRTSNRAYGTPR